LFVSVLVSTHASPQNTKPAGQPHAPSLQVRPSPQMLPHRPQLLSSVTGSAHAPPQSSRLVPHPPVVLVSGCASPGWRVVSFGASFGCAASIATE
jgi:hypothetical protein